MWLYKQSAVINTYCTIAGTHPNTTELIAFQLLLSEVKIDNKPKSYKEVMLTGKYLRRL